MSKKIFNIVISFILVFSFVISGFSQTAKKGIKVDYLDQTCEACEDFYKFANGGWLKTAEIPDEHTSWGGIQMLFERNRVNTAQNFRRSRGKEISTGQQYAKDRRFLLKLHEHGNHREKRNETAPSVFPKNRKNQRQGRHYRNYRMAS